VFHPIRGVDIEAPFWDQYEVDQVLEYDGERGRYLVNWKGRITSGNRPPPDKDVRDRSFVRPLGVTLHQTNKVLAPRRRALSDAGHDEKSEYRVIGYDEATDHSLVDEESEHRVIGYDEATGHYLVG